MLTPPPAKRARAQPPHERALELLNDELAKGQDLEDAVRAVTVGDDKLRDTTLACVRSSPELRRDFTSLAVLLADAPRARGVITPPSPSATSGEGCVGTEPCFRHNSSSTTDGVKSPTRTHSRTSNGAPTDESDSKRETAKRNEAPGMDGSTDEERGYYSALTSGIARGLSLEGAVSAALGGRARLATPVIEAIEKVGRLRDNLQLVATLCAAVSSAARIPRRPRLQLGLHGLSDVATLVERAREVVVLSGAGVSVSCGIPDFRSAGGLYDRLAREHGMADPQSVFDLGEFRLDPALFYAFAREVMPRSSVVPSRTHRFVAELAARGRLRRCYTQNIDGLETRAGVPGDKLVAAHGSFATATCQRCGASYQFDDYAPKVAAGDIPTCDKCQPKPGSNDDEDEYDDGNEAAARGVLKPDIVFFGERLPERVDHCLADDLHKADLVLVLGTSLMVAPVARIPGFFPPHLPRILVNRELVDYRFDVELLGDCDIVIERLRTLLGWDESSTETDAVPESEPRQSDTQIVDTVTFVPPRRFLFKGSKVTSDEPVENDEAISLFDLLGDFESSDSEEEGATSVEHELPNPEISNTQNESNHVKQLLDVQIDGLENIEKDLAQLDQVAADADPDANTVPGEE